MSDIEIDYGSDQEVSENHSKLIEAVSKLDKGQRVKKPQRSEPSLEVSEFHLVKSGISDKDAVHIDDLAKTLGSKGHHAEISKKLRATRQKSKVLPKPLEKPAADKLKRIVGFENTKKELEEWNAIVTRNRTAESLSFPLNQTSMRPEPTNEFVKRFRLQSDLEKELATLEPPKAIAEEKVDEFPLTLEEIMQKRKEAAKFRAQQSYKEAKAHRRNKIKSKKFHRIQRKERTKQQLKEFEELQKTDPQAALEKLEELDKSRAEERMSLRHKSTGQWAKNKQIRARYDKDSRQVLAQQLSISKALTQKIRSNADSDEDDEASNVILKESSNDRDNPWVNNVKTTSEIDDFISDYRKYWDEKNKTSGAAGEASDATEKNEISRATRTNENPKVSSSTKAIPKNPVESVSLEYEESKENIGSMSVKEAKTKEFTAKRCLKNFEKLAKVTKKSTRSSGDGLRLKNLSKKRKAGTSEWHVETLHEETTGEKAKLVKSIKIDELFESMEDKIISRIDAKLKSVRSKLATNATAREKLSAAPKRKKKPKEYGADLSFKKQKIRVDLDDEMIENTGISGNQSMRKSPELTKDSSVHDRPEIKKIITKNQINEIDPEKFINVRPKHLMTMMPDLMTDGDDALDDNENENDQHNIISEAFADDDVVEEFRKEKAEEIAESQPKDIDLRLPGWGTWSGKDIVKSTRKKRRFIMKFPKEAPRRDENKGDVVIIEEKDPRIREHQVSDLPFPFESVNDFEASIRAPIGRNFVTENAHKRFIRPAVKTKMGEIIEPMNADALIGKNPKPRKRKAGSKRDKKNMENIKL